MHAYYPIIREICCAVARLTISRSLPRSHNLTVLHGEIIAGFTLQPWKPPPHVHTIQTRKTPAEAVSAAIQHQQLNLDRLDRLKLQATCNIEQLERDLVIHRPVGG